MATAIVQNIMDLFRTAPQSAPANPNAGAPTGVTNPGTALPGTQQTQQTAPNGVVPVQDPGANPGDPGSSESPFEKHKGIWDTVAVDPNNASPDEMPFAKLDPAKVLESARKVDFAKIVTPELLAKIQAGGAEASAALVLALNGVAQTVYANSAIATTKIVESALTTERERSNKLIPGMVKRLSANEGLRTDNPLFSNPALSPLVEALTTQFQTKNPGATAGEIQVQIVDYFTSIGAAFAPKPVDTGTGKGSGKPAKSEDWSKFLEV